MSKTLAAAAAVAAALVAGSALAAGGAEKPKDVAFSFEGPFGTFDQAQLQRGYKVYREVCASCHSMSLLSFRTLGEKHGPFWSEEYSNPNDNPYVKQIASEFEIADIDSETGDPITRPGTTSDRFPAPFANPVAAAASNGGAVPPDLSVITKARSGGAEYVYSLLTGYVQPPAGLRIAPGQHYNKYMPGDLKPFMPEGTEHAPPGGFIAMAPPLSDGRVTYDDGTNPTLDQQAKDVSAFLAWASEPKMVERKQLGVAVLLYLFLFAGLTYLSYKRIWKNVAH
jgi:ubiquinol-cytochrome c reductase cytochrome c1 subunit